MTETSPNIPAEERKPSPEEIAILEEGKRQVERAKMAIGQPIPLMTDPNWLLTEEGGPVLAHALGRGVNNQPIAPKEGTVTVLIPHDFTYNATHHHRFMFRAGVREVPASLLDVKYIRDHGVVVYQRPAPQVQPIMGINAPTLRVGPRDMPSGPFVAQAYSESGMSVEEWNALGEPERMAKATECATRAEAAANASGANVPGAGAGTVQAQPQDRMQQARPPGQQPQPNKIAPGPPKK